MKLRFKFNIEESFIKRCVFIYALILMELRNDNKWAIKANRVTCAENGK